MAGIADYLARTPGNVGGLVAGRDAGGIAVGLGTVRHHRRRARSRRGAKPFYPNANQL